jgi:aerobic-type carbon monoxide dehydrogenase small subunit (CoxS/CutS family)
MSGTRTIAVTVNGKLREAVVTDDLPLISFLQDELDLTGTKFCCGIGVCRACTVAVWRTPSSVPDVLLTCVTKAVEVDGQSIRTVEGLARDGVLTPLQQAFLDEYAFQCGYSTPGFLMAGEVLLAQLKVSPIPASQVDAAIMSAVGAHICRCTGYVRYHAAIRKVILATPGLVKEA